MQICEVHGCHQQLSKPGHHLCLPHWKANRDGKLSWCPECGVLRERVFAVCPRCVPQPQSSRADGDATEAASDPPFALPPWAWKPILIATGALVLLAVLPTAAVLLAVIGVMAIVLAPKRRRGGRRQRWYREVYLKTWHWRRKRNQALRVHGRRCAECGSRTSLDVHHVRYGNLWREDPGADLQVLCRECHDAKH